MKKTLVIGASINPERYSYKAITMLGDYGHPVVAIGLKPQHIGDVKFETQMADFQDIDTVTLYLNPKRQEAYYEYILDLNPRRVIFNPGTENPEFYTILHAHAIQYVEACTLVLLRIGQY